MDGSTPAAKAKAKLKGNKKEEKEKNPKGKTGRGKGKEVVLNYAKFEGQGLSYKAKLFGFVEVQGPRGDQSSVQAIQKLKQQAKQLKKGANEHKLKITFNITLHGVRLFNEKTQTVEHEHPIHKISFISHDPEDRHVFGYIFSPPRNAANEKRKYYLFAIKSDKSADVITAQLYELFQVVYKMQENKKPHGNDNSTSKQRQHEKSAQPLEPLQDKMLLEMSNKIGGDQQHQYSPDEHLYMEPTLFKRTLSEQSSDYANPTDQPFKTTDENESNEYQVPRKDGNISDKEREDIAMAIALSLSMHESSQSLSTSISTPVNDGSDLAMAIPKEKISDENAFHVAFPLTENGVTSPDDFEKSGPNLSGSFSNSEKFKIPGDDSVRDFPSTNEVKSTFETSLSASVEDDVVFSSMSSEREDCPNTSTELELRPKEGVIEDMSSIPTDPHVVTIQSQKQNDNDLNNFETGLPVSNGTKELVTQTSFEVNFETEGDNETSTMRTEDDVFSVNGSSDVFSSEDPFASTGPNEFDQSTFTAIPDSDPFSPIDSSHAVTLSYPFSENDNLFADNENPFLDDRFTYDDKSFKGNFGDSHTSEFEPPNRDITDELNSENDQNSNKSNDDIFEALFEAKMEGEFENEPLTTTNDNEIEHNKFQQNHVEFDKKSRDTIVELDNQEKKMTEKPEEYQVSLSLSNKKTIDRINNEIVNSNSPVLNNEMPQELQDDAESSDQLHMEEANTFDFTSNDTYVTLVTTALSSKTTQSPIEFSPPPLPPRSIIPQESIDNIVSPKVPPALPPRPSMTFTARTETSFRKPPELPPRLDLETDNSVKNVDDNEMFQASLDDCHFGRMDHNTPAENIGTPTRGFDSSDPFKDPFVGTDPFQTPIAGDPFASAISFDRDLRQETGDFDPFSGDDPFAMTPSFDSQTSFDSPSTTNFASDDEKGNNEEKEKFVDFSTAFT